MKYILTNTTGDIFQNEESYPNDDCVFDELLSYGEYGGMKAGEIHTFIASKNSGKSLFNEFVKLKVGNQ